MWVRDPAEGRRLATYGASLAGGSALGFLVFASYANRAPVCDALSPVWLSVVAAGGAMAVGMTLLAPRSWIDRTSRGQDRATSLPKPAEARQPGGEAVVHHLSKRGDTGIEAAEMTEYRQWPLRLSLAAAAGAALAAGFVLFWPHCLGRLEGASPELVHLWLGNVREARPLYMHGYSTAIAVAALPAAGLVGYAIMLWVHRRDRAKLVAWGATAAPALLAALLLLWQSRAGPAAQLLAVPGATALVWPALASRFMLVRVVGTVALFLVASGLLPQQVLTYFPPPPRPGMKVVNKANDQCPRLWALKPVAQVPRGQVLTFVDLGPRLITLTHHDAVAGPYHRNGQDIIDVMRTFRGTADSARATIERRRIDYVLICPGLSESTVYASQAKDGFYAQLARGRIPAWLQPVPLPANSPYRMWRVVRSKPGS
jgi:hypothetical protein